MKTLFLNPNSSDAVTGTLRRQIAARAAPSLRYEVCKLDGAPRIIGSARDDADASALLEERWERLLAGFDRLVLLSSLDTGFEAVRRRPNVEVRGFTRSVLAWHRRHGRHLQALTFDPAMTPLYRALFEADGHAGVVERIVTLPTAPAAAAGAAEATLDALRARCEALARDSSLPIFVVGAVGLEPGERLRAEGWSQVIDPIADLLAELDESDRQAQAG